MTILYELANKTNIYLNSNSLNYNLLNNISEYIQYIFKCFGFSVDNSNTVDTTLPNEIYEKAITPIMNHITSFRDEMKQNSLAIFNYCDNLRANLLKANIQIEDKGKGQPSIWKIVNPEEKKQEVAKKVKKEEKAVTPPDELFKSETDKFSKFDEKGIPTHYLDGTEIPKDVRGQFIKKYSKQEKLYKKYLETKEKDTK